LTIDNDLILSFTGEVSPNKRVELWNKGRVIVSTPQVIENDILAGRIDLSDVILIIFDEAHRAVGNYSYVFVASNYRKHKKDGSVLGITASPGSEIEKILEVCRNLGITNIEIRTKNDPDVKPYVQEMDIVWRKIELPIEFVRIIKLLRESLAERLKALKEGGVIESASVSAISRKKLLEAQSRIQSALKEGRVSRVLFTLASVQNEALKIYHAIELLQTQGTTALKMYFERLRAESKTKGGSKASKRIMEDPLVIEAMAYLRDIDIEHPKIKEVANIVEEQFEKHPDSRVIVFTNYRDTSIKVEEELKNCKGVKPVRFIGQAARGGDRGMSQKRQAEILEKFREGEFNTLIATSVAEEGIDIPSTDMVVFYEPIPSEIRTIQRRGRTGRRRAGKVVILIAKGTPDEGYYWSSLKKEKRMRRELERLRRELKRKLVGEEITVSPSQKKLTDFSKDEENRKESKDCKEEQDELTIITDVRECRSPVVKIISESGIKIIPKQLDIGDYVISDRICIERKSVDDFLESMISGRLFRQLSNLRNAYQRPILIIEGEGLFTRRNISHSSIYGCIVSIIVDYETPVVFTRDSKETAELLSIMARREQKEVRRDIALRGERKSMTLKERQQFIIEGLPNISATLAKRLLNHFKTIKNIANADENELFQVPGIGKVTAQEIINVFNTIYDENA
ncbi:MAG TPA: DEAD/DEAH box helicase, partial [Thermoplasmatales archaeon]|nr:DEAD/DEAH box helicase [Thermoplasmatales archaeon]